MKTVSSYRAFQRLDKLHLHYELNQSEQAQGFFTFKSGKQNP